MSLCERGPLAAVLSSRESPAEPSSLGPCESRHTAPGVRVPVQTVFAAGVQISPLAARFKGSKLCGRPFMWTRVISGTYVHNLQRTTPTAFSRFSCVLCALCLLALTCQRALHHPEDDGHRQWAHRAARGRCWRAFMSEACCYVRLVLHSSAARNL